MKNLNKEKGSIMFTPMQEIISKNRKRRDKIYNRIRDVLDELKNKPPS